MLVYVGGTWIGDACYNRGETLGCGDLVRVSTQQYLSKTWIAVVDNFVNCPKHSTKIRLHPMAPEGEGGFL